MLRPVPGRTPGQSEAWLALAEATLRQAANTPATSPACLEACSSTVVPAILSTAREGCPAAALQAEQRSRLVSAASAVLLRAMRCGCAPHAAGR